MAAEMNTVKHRGGTAKRAAALLAPAPAELSDAKKKLQLVQFAEKIFLEKNYHDATMNDVASAAGMSKKTVYKLFNSKSDLFMATMAHHAGRLVIPPMPDDWTIRESLIHVLLSISQFMLAPERIAGTRLIMAAYTHNDKFGTIFQQKRVTKTKAILEHWLSKIGPPDYIEVTQIKEMGAILYGMALGEFQLSTLVGFRQVPTKAALITRIHCVVDMFLANYEA